MIRRPLTPARVLITRDKRVALLDDERWSGNGVIITLHQGWTFSPGEDNRVRGTANMREALAMLRTIKPFAGPFDP